MKYILIAFSFIMGANYCLAGESSGVGVINSLYLNANGTFVRVSFSLPSVNPDSCQKDGHYFLELDESAGHNRFLSMVLAAYAAQKPVSFYINGCTTGSYWGGTRPKIHDIHIQ